MKKSHLAAAALLLAALMFCGCGLDSFDDTLADAAINLDSCVVRIYFKDEMSGGVSVSTLLEGDDASSFIAAMSFSTPIREPDENYSVQMSASHQIVMSVGDTDRLCVYYDDVNNWLVVPVTQETKSGSLMRYSFFTPDPVFSALVNIAYAERESDEEDEQLETSDLVLRASVTSDMLGQTGTNVDYELYTGSYAYTDTSAQYHIYTSEELPDVLSGSEGLILAALGEKPTTGYAIYISNVDYSDYLIRVFVYTEAPEYPDDEDQETTCPYVMATCDLDDFPMGLTVVFIDQNYNILGVETIDVP